MAFTADFNSLNERKLPVLRNINLAYNPATNANFPFSNIADRPYPDWGSVGILTPEGLVNTRALDTSFTKRFSKHWQMSATYSLAGKWDASPALFPGVSNLPGDLAYNYGLAAGDQRHRATANGVWEVGHGFQLSGLYFFGSGERFGNTWGPDLRDTGNVSTGTAQPVSIGRLEPNGTIVPRNSFVGQPIQRVDMRLLQRIPLGGNRSADAIFEIFNVFNHSNYGTYVLQESNPQYGHPLVNSAVEYGPRIVQLGFRIQF